MKVFKIAVVAMLCLSVDAYAGLLDGLSKKSEVVPDFVVNHFMNQPFSALSPQHKSAAERTPCPSHIRKSCGKEKKCECSRIVVRSYADNSQVIYVTVSDGKIVEYTDQISFSRTFGFEKVYPSVRSFFGDTEPTEVYQFRDQYGYRGFSANWIFDGGYATGVFFCKLDKVAGTLSVTTPLRQCLLQAGQITLLRSPEKQTKKPVQIKY